MNCFDNFPRSIIEKLIHEWIRSERDRNILERRILDGVKYEPLAEEFQISATHVKRIVDKNSKILMEVIKNGNLKT